MLFYKEIFTVKAPNGRKLKVKPRHSLRLEVIVGFKVDCLLSRDQPEVMFVKSELNGVRLQQNSWRLYLQNELIKPFSSLKDSLTNFLNDPSFPSVHHGELLSAFCNCSMCN